MRVLCVNVVSVATGDDPPTSPWLTRDREYEVLELYASPGRSVHLRIESDDAATPALFDSTMFLVTDGSIPPGWEARLDEGGVLSIGPREWLEPGFWEAYFDRDPAALEAYDRGRARAS